MHRYAKDFLIDANSSLSIVYLEMFLFPAISMKVKKTFFSAKHAYITLQSRVTV